MTESNMVGNIPSANYCQDSCEIAQKNINQTGPRGLVVKEPRLRCPPSRVRAPVTTDLTWFPFAPGPIATEMFFEGKSSELVEKIATENPFGRLGEAKDVVPLVGFLASDGGEWINGQSQTIPVNDGYV
uniref:Uncharacterized protein n=1 Tax=Brassica oleracea var. oleracea TaxID=109376 RepID=A0A0D3AFQ4_BRAOL